MSTDATVVLSGHLPWWSQSQTPHYLAALLARRACVLYVEPRPAWSTSTASFSLRQHLTLLRGPLRHVRENLWVYTPPALPLGRLSRIASWNEQLFATGLRRALDRLPSRRHLLWLAETQNGPLLAKLLPGIPRIFHAIDYFVTEREARAAHDLAAHADLVLAATPRIRAFLQPDNNRIHVFRNGWSFAPNALREIRLPLDIARIPRPRVGLVSYLSTNLDYALLQTVVQHLPVSLVCIGRPIGSLSKEDHALLNSIRTSPRAFFLGEKPTESLPPYLRAFDVCIAPYKSNDRIYASDPLKVYQYLAFGKPVVATPVEVLEPLHPLVKIGRTHDEYLMHLRDELQTPPEPWLQRLRHEFGDSSRWDSRWTELDPVLARYPSLAFLCESHPATSSSAAPAGQEQR